MANGRNKRGLWSSQNSQRGVTGAEHRSRRLWPDHRLPDEHEEHPFWPFDTNESSFLWKTSTAHIIKISSSQFPPTSDFQALKPPLLKLAPFTSRTHTEKTRETYLCICIYTSINKQWGILHFYVFT